MLVTLKYIAKNIAHIDLQMCYLSIVVALKMRTWLEVRWKEGGEEVRFRDGGEVGWESSETASEMEWDGGKIVLRIR